MHADGLDGILRKVFQCLDLIINSTRKSSSRPRSALRDEGAMDMKAYLQYVRDESKKCFDDDLPSLEALSESSWPYGEWRARRGCT